MAFIKSNKFEGSALECARCAKGLDFGELAGLSGIDRRRLIRFEMGIDYPNDIEIKSLAKATDVLPKFFFKAWVKPPEYAFNFRI